MGVRSQDADFHVGARMRERRVMLGLTQQQAADLIGVTYQQLTKYERGINRIAAGRLYAIAQVLAVDVSYFFDGVNADAQPLWSSPKQRQFLALAKDFGQVKDPRHQKAICEVARLLRTEGDE